MGGFQTHNSKCSERGVKLNFFIFFHRGIRNKKACKVKNFQVRVPQEKAKKQGAWFNGLKVPRREE